MDTQSAIRRRTIRLRRISTAGRRISRLGFERRLDRLSRRRGSLSSLRLARLPVGQPHRHRQASAGSGKRDRHDRGRSGARRARLGFSRRTGLQPRSGQRLRFSREAYRATDPAFDGRVTVPVLWDKETHRIVNNSEDDICRMFDGAFRAFGDCAMRLFPSDIAAEQAELSQLHLRKSEQRRLSRRLCHSPARL